MSPRKTNGRVNGKRPPKASKRAAKRTTPKSEEQMPQLSQAQKDKLRQLEEQATRLKCAHSDAVIRAQQLAAEREKAVAALHQTAVQMVQSLGLTLDDEDYTYDLDTTEGVVTRRARKKLTATTAS